MALQVILIGTLGSLALAAEETSQSLWTVIPPCVSAVGTILAFGVTFTLFLEAWKERVREQASQVYVISHRDNDGTLVATVHNRSSQPIWEVEAHPMRGGEIQPIDSVPERPDLPPDGKTMFTVVDDPGIERNWHLRFLDAAQRTWVRQGAKLTQEGKSRLFR